MSSIPSERSFIPIAKPQLGEEEKAAVVAVLESGMLAQGRRVAEFEARFAELCGGRHAVAVASGTAALWLTLLAHEIGPGDEVITTPFSFIASSNCALFVGAKPVFVDIEEGSYTMDPGRLEAAITPRTKAIMPVEVFGNTAHFDEYERIARKHGLLLIEDCCEALGAGLGDRPAGSFGECGVFAFYPNKQITTGEGGMIVTDDDKLAGLCLSLRNQGRADSADFDGEQSSNVARSCLGHERLGYNYRLSEIA